MELYTRIPWAKPRFQFDYADRITLMGSCFAESIGSLLTENKFTTDVNPFGILYNPASVAEGLRMLLHPERFTPEDLFLHEGTYHSFAHHGRFSSTSADECLERINGRLFQSSDFLREATRLVITLGTAYVYRLRSTGKIVANCHKLPEGLFERRRLSASEIVEEWRPLLLALWEQNPELKILFTVSPIRHWKDGAHENQLSKATLLLAEEALRQEFPERIDYFPAYEILLDELRDYRFYADDMLHPSPLAVDYIWQHFVGHLLSADARSALMEWEGIRKALLHKPFHPESEAYAGFLRNTLARIARLHERLPSLPLDKEEEELRAKLREA